MYTDLRNLPKEIETICKQSYESNKTYDDFCRNVLGKNIQGWIIKSINKSVFNVKNAENGQIPVNDIEHTAETKRMLLEMPDR